MATLRELLGENGAVRGDAPATMDTQHTMAVGDVFLGKLSDPDDQDWVRIELQPATTYVIRLEGHGEDPVGDPLLELYDAEGLRVAFNDDVTQGGSLDSKIVFTTPACEDPADENSVLVYYVNARSYALNPAFRYDGDYRLSLSEQQPLAAPDTPPAVPDSLLDPDPTVRGANDTYVGGEGDDILEGRSGADTLDGGGQPEDGIGDTASYYHARDAVHVSLADGRGYTGPAKGDTLIDIENLIGSDYEDTLVGDTGDNILIGGWGDDILDGGPGADLLVGGHGVDTVTYRYAYSTHGVRVDLALGVADGSAAEGDTLIGIENVTGSLQDDELYGDDTGNRLRGHAGDDVLAGRGGYDVFVFYPDGGHDTILDFDAGKDRLELHLYDHWSDWRELDMETEGGNTVIRIDQDNSLTLTGATPAELGERNFEFVREKRPVRAKEADDRVEQAAGGDSDCVVGVTLAGAAGNDTLTGTECDDTIDGLGGDDTLKGLGGDDELTGGPGADTLDGGEGLSDYAKYDKSASAVTINLGGVKDGDGYITGSGGDAEGDKLKNIENLVGSAHDDTLTGDGNANRLVGGAGADTLDGGAGSDYAFYDTSSAGVMIVLDTVDNNGYSTGKGGDAEGDKLKNIENLVGSAHDDTLIGNSNTNRLVGGPGADTLDGIGGSDYALYDASSAGVTINLGGTQDNYGYITGSGGDAEGDKLANIAHLQGSAHDDTLTGDYYTNNYLWGGAGADTLDGGGEGKNRLYGEDGNDTLTGGDGQDRLYGGDGNDTLNGGGDFDRLYGGPGADTIDGGGNNPNLWWGDYLQYNDSTAGVTINLGGAQDSNGYITGSGGDAEGDKIKNAESVVGSAHDDVLTGDDKHNILAGLGGDDTLSGGQGDDHLYGGPGDDTLIGGPGSDTFLGAAGDDTMTGGAGVDGYVYYRGLTHSDTVTDFTRGEDFIYLTDFGLSGINDPKLTITTGPTDTLIRLVDTTSDSDVTITLEGVTASLSAGDFYFS